MFLMTWYVSLWPDMCPCVSYDLTCVLVCLMTWHVSSCLIWPVMFPYVSYDLICVLVSYDLTRVLVCLMTWYVSSCLMTWHVLVSYDLKCPRVWDVMFQNTYFGRHLHGDGFLWGRLPGQQTQLHRGLSRQQRQLALPRSDHATRQNHTLPRWNAGRVLQHHYI